MKKPTLEMPENNQPQPPKLPPGGIAVDISPDGAQVGLWLRGQYDLTPARIVLPGDVVLTMAAAVIMTRDASRSKVQPGPGGLVGM